MIASVRFLALRSPVQNTGPHLRFLALALPILLVGLFSAGCAKKKATPEEKPTSKDPAQVKVVPSLPPSPPLPPRLDLDDVLRYIPADTRAVAVLHVPALQREEANESVRQMAALGDLLYRRHLVPELKKVDKHAVTDVTSILVAMPYSGWPGGTIIVRGKVDGDLLATQLRACGKESKDVREVKPDKSSPVPIFRRETKDKDVDVFAKLLPDPLPKLMTAYTVHLAAVDDQTLILTVQPNSVGASVMKLDFSKLLDLKLDFGKLLESGEKGIVGAIEARPTDTKPVISGKLVGLLKQLDRRDWGTMVIMEDHLLPMLKPLLPDTDRASRQCEHCVGTMRAEKDTTGTLVVTCKDDTAAGEIEENLTKNTDLMRKEVFPTLSWDPKRKALLEELGNSLKVSRKGRVVTATAKLSSEKAQRLLLPEKKD